MASGIGFIGTDSLAGLAKSHFPGTIAKNTVDNSALPDCINPCFIVGSPDSYPEKSASNIDCGN